MRGMDKNGWREYESPPRRRLAQRSLYLRIYGASFADMSLDAILIIYEIDRYDTVWLCFVQSVEYNGDLICRSHNNHGLIQELAPPRRHEKPLLGQIPHLSI